MRMSRGVTVTILGGLLLTSCLTTGGCGRGSARDHTWYDASGHRIEEKWKTTADGKRVPDPHPYDRHGRQWVYDSAGNLVPPDPPRSAARTAPLFLWGGSGYRSGSSGSSYRSGSSRSSSSISRGGFGSTGSRSSS